MADIDKLEIKIIPTGVEEAEQKLKQLKNTLIELKNIGIKQKTLNLIIRDLFRG